MSEVAEIKSLLDQQGRTFEALKAANDSLEAQVKKFGEADTLTKTELKTINSAMDKVADQIKVFADVQKAAANANDRLDQIETALKRTGKGGEDEKNAAIEIERKAFRAFAKKGGHSAFDDFVAREAEFKALSVGSDPDGGYTVLPDLSGRVIQKVYETSPMRQVASVQTITTDALEGPIDNEEASCGWVSETGARSETNTPQLGQWRIPVHEIYANPRATQKVLDDSIRDPENWLAGKVSDKFIRTENTAFVSGNGDGKPRGFLDYSSTNVADASRAWGVLEFTTTGTSASYGTSSNGADKLISLAHSMKAAYRTGAVWMMSRATLGTTRTLKDAQGAYIWLPAMTAGQNSSLLQYPVVEAEDMPAIAANSLSVAFGNFRLGYQIVDRQGVRVLRDPYTAKPYVQFYTTKRVGGDVLHFETIKFLKFG